MNDDVMRAALCCQQNSISNLQTIVPDRIRADSTVKSIKLNSLLRSNVPLICVAAASGSLDCVKYLLRKEAKVSQTDSKGYSALHWASMTGHHLVVGFLIQNGASPNQNPGDTSPLILAARYGRIECVGLLIEAGADLQKCDFTGRSPIHYGSWFNHLEIVKLLVNKGAQIDAADSAGRTPLHLCCWFGNFQTFSFLMEKSASLNIQDKAGNTPLHLACQHNLRLIVEALLAAGADTKIKNTVGQTAEQIAEAEEKAEIVEIFQKKEGEKEKTRKQSVHIDKGLLHETKSMNKMLEEILAAQEKQSQIIKQLKDRLDQEVSVLNTLNHTRGEASKQLGEVETITRSIIESMKSITPQTKKSTRFTLSKVPLHE